MPSVTLLSSKARSCVDSDLHCLSYLALSTSSLETGSGIQQEAVLPVFPDKNDF